MQQINEAVAKAYRSLDPSVAERLVSLSLVGSRLYGINREDSDWDFIGVYVPDYKELFSINNIIGYDTDSVFRSDNNKSTYSIQKDNIDITVHSIEKFIKLAQNSPNIIEAVFCPPEYLRTTNIGTYMLSEIRRMVASRTLIANCIAASLHQADSKTNNNLNNIRHGASRQAFDEIFCMALALHSNFSGMYNTYCDFKKTVSAIKYFEMAVHLIKYFLYDVCEISTMLKRLYGDIVCPAAFIQYTGILLNYLEKEENTLIRHLRTMRQDPYQKNDMRMILIRCLKMAYGETIFIDLNEMQR